MSGIIFTPDGTCSFIMPSLDETACIIGVLPRYNVLLVPNKLLYSSDVIKLSNKWFLSLGEIYKMSSVFFYLIFRFANISGRMFWGMFFKNYK